jgi:hypothetical protein
LGSNALDREYLNKKIVVKYDNVDETVTYNYKILFLNNEVLSKQSQRKMKKHLNNPIENVIKFDDIVETEEMFENAGYMFLEVKDYNDAKQKSDECFEKAEIARVELEKRQELARQKAENVGGISQTWFGYRTLIPLCAVCMMTLAEFDSLTGVVTAVAMAIAYIVYRRTFKLKMLDVAIILAVFLVAVGGAIF